MAAGLPQLWLCTNRLFSLPNLLQIVKKGELEAGKVARSGRKRDPIEDLQREIAVMRRMLHPNVVALREVSTGNAARLLCRKVVELHGASTQSAESHCGGAVCSAGYCWSWTTRRVNDTCSNYVISSPLAGRG